MDQIVIFFVNASKLYQFKEKNFERKKYPLCLGHISNDFSGDNMKKNRLNEYVHDFNVIDTSNIIDIHKYLTKNII